MPTISGNVGAVFNGGTITQPVVIDPSALNATGLTVTAPAGASGDLLDVLNNGTYGMFVDTTGSVTIQGDPASSARALNVQQLAVGQTILRLLGSASTVLTVKEDDKIGFFGASAATKPTVTGAKLPSDVALASLLTALATLGLITDSTT